MRAYAHDLKTFFTVVGKDPVEVRAKDVFGFITAQQRARAGAENVARISDGGSGLSAATIRRRLAAVSAFYGYLIARGDVGWRRTRCRGVCRRGAGVGTAGASRWCGRCVGCRASWNPARWRR